MDTKRKRYHLCNIVVRRTNVNFIQDATVIMIVCEQEISLHVPSSRNMKCLFIATVPTPPPRLHVCIVVFLLLSSLLLSSLSSPSLLLPLPSSLHPPPVPGPQGRHSSEWLDTGPRRCRGAHDPQREALQPVQ